MDLLPATALNDIRMVLHNGLTQSLILPIASEKEACGIVVITNFQSAMSILRPNASVRGLPFATPGEAPKGFTLGEHVEPDDPIEAGDQTGITHTLGPAGRQFSPYENNGGTVVAVSGKDYSIVASDTRLGSGYSIPSRYVSRIIKLTDKVVLASSGMQSDIAVLHKVLKIRIAQYKYNHHKDMSLTAVSQMLSTMLYYRRFQPYYTFNVLGGIDENGKSRDLYAITL